MKRLFNNNASSILAVNLAQAGLTLSITPADFSKYPAPSGTDYFMATIIKSSGAFEIVKVTTNNNDGTFVIERANEGTAALDFVIGDKFQQRLTAGALNNFSQNNTELQVNLNADMVDGIQAVVSPQANKLLALDVDGDLPTDIKGDAQTLQGLTPSQLKATTPPTIQSFTADGIYTAPAGITSILVMGIGGGGGGGAQNGTIGQQALGGMRGHAGNSGVSFGSSANSGGGGGGGGIGYIKIDSASLVNASENIVIGVGSIAGGDSTPALSGTASSFGAFMSFGGGGGGINRSDGAYGGQPGVCSPLTVLAVYDSIEGVGIAVGHGGGSLQAGNNGMVIVFEYY